MREKKEYFEKLARDWDREHHTAEEIERTRRFAANHFGLNPGETILDAGCGTGRLIPHLQAMIRDSGRVVELDASHAMLKIGKARYPDRNLLFIQGDGHRLPLKDRSVDTVICFAFFPHLGDPRTAMASFARVLKPGGRIFIAHQMNREELNRFHANVNGPVGDDMLPDEEGMKTLFETSGFAEVSIREEPGLYLATAKAK